MITLNDFIAQIDQDPSNISEHIIQRYVPIEEKQARAKLIVQSSSVEVDAEGNESYRANSVAKYVLTGLTLLELYTDVQRTGDVLKDFNQLNERRIFAEIVKEVNEDEIEEFYEVIKMEEEDLAQNEFEPHGFIKEQVERFGTLIGTALSGIDWEELVNRLSR